MSDESPDESVTGTNPPPRPSGQPRHPWVWAHQAGPATRHTTTTLVLAIVAALLAGMIVGAGAVGLVWAVRDAAPVDGAPDRDSSDDAESAGDGQAAEDVLPGELDRLMAYVEEERGLSFTEEVEVQFLDDDAFADAWFTVPPGYEPPDGPSDYAATYAALGLTTSPDDFYAAEQSTSLGGLMGFYDPWTDELVVRGTEWTPMVEGTVVHELTHALQDQHFDLTTILDGPGPEADLAARALIEGDANRVELAYVDDQPADWQDEYIAAWDDVRYGGPYDPLLEMIGSMPYWLGDVAITRLVEEGNGQVNTALRNPPTTSAEIVEIERFIGGELPEVTPPDAPPAPVGARILDEGTLGVGFLELLHLDVQTDWFGNDYLSGWRGDRYTTWESDEGACTEVVIKLEAGTVDDAVKYFDPWVERTGGDAEQLADGHGITLTSCAEW